MGVLGAKRTSSRFLNAGAVMGTAAALKQLYNGAIAPVAESPEGLRWVQQYADAVGHWFLHSLDQFLIWEYLFRKQNWPDSFKSSKNFKFGTASDNGFVNVDIPDEMIFDADLEKFKF